MKTKEILTIVSLAALGVCLLCGLAKMVMKKGDKGHKHCKSVCATAVVLAIILLAVSQLLGENDGFKERNSPYCELMPSPNKLCHTRGGECTKEGAGTPINPNGTPNTDYVEKCPPIDSPMCGPDGAANKVLGSICAKPPCSQAGTNSYWTSQCN